MNYRIIYRITWMRPALKSDRTANHLLLCICLRKADD